MSETLTRFINIAYESNYKLYEYVITNILQFNFSCYVDKLRDIVTCTCSKLVFACEHENKVKYVCHAWCGLVRAWRVPYGVSGTVCCCTLYTTILLHDFTVSRVFRYQWAFQFFTVSLSAQYLIRNYDISFHMPELLSLPQFDIATTARWSRRIHITEQDASLHSPSHTYQTAPTTNMLGGRGQ